VICAFLASLALAATASARTTATHPFISSFNGSDSTPGAFGALGRIAIGEASGDIYAIDADHSAVVRFDATGRAAPFTSLQVPAGSNALDGSNTPDSTFGFVAGGDSDVAVDNSGTASDGNVIVDSEPNFAIYAFDSTGTYLWKVGGFGDACGVAVDTRGNVWASDYNAETVTEYTSAGTPTGTVLDTSAINHPCHIAFDSNDNLYVDMWQGPVEKYDSSLRDLGQVDAGPAFAVAVDRNDDHLYVDHDTSIAEYDASGNPVDSFGGGRLLDSPGVAVDGSTGHASSGNVVASDSGAALVDIFGPLFVQALPDVTTGVPSNIGPTTAHVGGIFNPDGLAVTCSFDYGTSTAYGSSAPCSSNPGSGTSDVSVGADLSGLTPGTTYHYRLTGTSRDGTATGLDATFTTPQAPSVGGGTATIGSTSATLKAIVNPQGAATTYHFEYGTDTSYGTSAPVPDASAGSSASDRNVSVDVSGLQPSTTYHFRIVATNAGGATDGADHAFTTRAAQVADTCPNAGLRQQQGATLLPDCRAWELVSAADAGFSRVNQVSPLATDGDRVMYDILGGAPGTSSGARPELLATRTAAGWVSTSMLPPAPQLIAQTYLFNAASPTLDGYVASAFDGLGESDQSPDVTIVRIDTHGHQTVLHRFPRYFGDSGVDLAASDDLRHVYASVPEAIDPSHQPGTWNLYDFGSGTPALVGTMPSTGVAPTCGLEPPGSSFTQTGFVIGAATAAEHWTSTDGSRVFFQTRGDDTPNCDGPLQLYVHDLDSGRSTLISGPPVGGDPDNGVDRFLQATPDGSVVIFRTPTSYTAADDADGNASDMDVYRWTASSGALECITCGMPQANVLDPTIVSDDGAYVYFSSTAQFDGAPAGATSSTPNTYVWHDGAIHFVAQTDGISDLTASTSLPSQVTPDGRVLVFPADTADLNARTRSDNGGLPQYYRYDAGDGSLTCMSCPTDGSAATAAAATPLTTLFTANFARLRAVSDDGSTAVFRTSTALVTEDRNDGPDLYEWHDGHVGLVTSGTARISDPSLVELSADGRDILFTDLTSLTADAQGVSYKLYDARVDGGFAPAPPPPSPCAGDQCRGALSGAPSLADPATGSTSGAGNVKPPTPPRLSLGAITSAARARFARTGVLAIHVRVNKAGTVAIAGSARLGGHVHTVVRASRKTSKAATVTLTLRLSRAARSRLAHGASLRIVLVVRFGSASRRVTLTLVPANGR